MTQQLRPFMILLGLGLVTVGLASGCSSDGDSTATATTTATEASGETSVNVTLEEWSVGVDTASVPAGEVMFNVENKGTIPHEMVVVRSDAAPDALPVVDAKVDEDQVNVVGEVEEIPAGESDDGTFDLEPGNYILFCNIPAHYGQGMHIAFTVQ